MKSAKREFLVVCLTYLVLSVIYTFPLILKLGSSIYGYAGDNLGAIRYLWWWKFTFLNHLDIRNSYLEQAPFGFRIDSETGSVFYSWPLKVLTLLFDQLTAYNIVLLLSFPVAALSMYLLTRFVLTNFLNDDSRNKVIIFWISLWSGFVFSFSPYHFWKAYNHLDLALIWPFPLAVLFLLKSLKEAKVSAISTRTVLLCSVFTAVTVLTNFYYGFFLLLSFVLVYSFFFIVYRPKFKTVFISAILNFLVTLLLVIPFIAPTVLDAYVNKGAGESAARVANYDRPLLDVVSLSARPWDYLIPSQDNPLLGNISKIFYKWIRDQGGDFKVISGPVHERTIFLGYVSILLVILGVVLLILKKEFREKYGKFLTTLLLIILLLVLISMPPYIFLKGKFTVYLPSYLLYKLAPMFRTYSRLGIFVLMFVIIYSSIILNYLSRNLSRIKLASYFLLLTSFSALEFANVPPSKVVDLKEPQAFDYIGKQPGSFSFIVYPKEFNVAELLAFQPKFQKGFLNFHSQSPYYKLWDYLSNFHDPKVPRLLSSLGVKYVAFQKKLVFAEPNPVDDLWYTRALRDPIGGLPPGFVLERDYVDSAVYSVNADPIGFIVIADGKTDVFPKSPYTLKEDVFRIYLADVKNVPSVDLMMKIIGTDGKEVPFTSVSGENVSIQHEGVTIKFGLNREMGFIDITGVKKGTVISSIDVEAINKL